MCGSPDYFALHGVPRTPNDLISHNCLKYTFSSWGNEWRFKSSEGQRAVHVTGNMEANSVNALKLAAALGQGLIIAPEFLVTEEIKSGKLVAVLTEFASPELPIHAVYPHRQHLSTNVRSFLDLLAKHCRGADRETADGDAQDTVPIRANGARKDAQLAALASKAERPQPAH